jgi:chromosome segregation ATPase
MKLKLAIAVLIVACVLLGIGLVYRHGAAIKQQDIDQATILKYSNVLDQTTTELNQERQRVNEMVTNLARAEETIGLFKTELKATSNTLSRVQSEALAAAEKARQELAVRDKKIAELESQNDDLDKQMIDLNTSLGSLKGRIAETERKLAASEGDREFLLAELQRLQTEKAEIEQKFNDLAVLREQVRKLRDELSLARRIEWIRQGLYGDTRRGAELLAAGVSQAVARTNYNLEVELRQDGGARVVPAPTNRPAGTGAPSPR